MVVSWIDFKEFLKYGKSGKKIDTPSTFHETAFKRIYYFVSKNTITRDNRHLLFSHLKSTYPDIKKNSTLNCYLKVAKHLAEYLLTLDKASPYFSIFYDMKGLTEEIPDIIPFTDLQVEQIVLEAYKMPDMRTGIIIDILSVTALRNASEICLLKWADLIDDTLIIRHTKNRRPHSIKLPFGYREKLLAYKSKLPKDTVYMFPGRGTNGYIKYDTINSWLKKAVKMAGIERDPKDIHAHLLRHSLATIALENDAGLEKVSEYLNHKDIKSTMKYTHLTARKTQEKVQRHIPYIAKNMTLKEFENDHDDFMRQYRNTPIEYEKKRLPDGRIEVIYSV